MYQNEKTVVCYGVDKFRNFISRKWTDKKGNKCYNFWDIYSKHPRTAVNYDAKELKE